MTENKKKRGRPPGSGKKPKSVLDEAVSIPYERQVSDDPQKQTLNDLMELGRCAMEFKPDGIRRIDPLSPEVTNALYNAEHPNQYTETYTAPYPSNWDKMTKTEKLAYFTQHRK